MADDFPIKDADPRQPGPRPDQGIKLQTQNIDRLAQLLGFDPLAHVLSNDVMREALKEVQEERDQATKDQLKDQLRKLMDIRLAMEKLKREFLAVWNKHHKELGKGVNRINARLAGRDPDAEGQGEHQDGGESQSQS